MTQSINKNRIKNFYRISKLLSEKCAKVNPLLGLVSESFVDFITEQGKGFYEKKGVDIYLKTARFYYDLLNKPSTN